MSENFYYTKNQERFNKCTDWLSKYGWIIQTIVSLVGLIIAIIALLSKF